MTAWRHLSLIYVCIRWVAVERSPVVGVTVACIYQVRSITVNQGARGKRISGVLVIVIIVDRAVFEIARYQRHFHQYKTQDQRQRNMAQG